MKKRTMAKIHKTTCALPALTAVPKNSGTMIMRIWAKTRSNRPSSLRRAALWDLTDSARLRDELLTVVTVQFRTDVYGFASRDFSVCDSSTQDSSAPRVRLADSCS